MIEIKNEYEVRGNVTAIFLRRKDGSLIETIIDTEDFSVADSLQGRWMSSDQTLSSYVKGHLPTRKGKMIILHRLLMGNPKGKSIDHINGNTLDNRKENLRIVNKSENGQNRIRLSKRNTSGYRNVYWDKAKSKWMVSIYLEGKTKFIGYFDDKEKANEAAIEARTKYMPFSKEGTHARN